MLLAGAAAGAKRCPESRADDQPEHQRRRQYADHARGLAVEAHDLAPPQSERRQRNARGCRPSYRTRQRCCLSCHYGFAFAAGAVVEAAGFGAAGALAGSAFFLPIRPRSRISQYAFSRKHADNVSRMSVMKRPSTVTENGESTIIPPTKIQTTPRNDNKPSTRESTRIIGRKLPPLFLFRFRNWFALFTPEFVAGAVDEDIFQRRLAHRNRLNLAGEGLDYVGNKAVSALAFDAHLVAQYRSFDMETRANVIGQQRRIMRGVEHNHVATDFALQFWRRA